MKTLNLFLLAAAALFCTSLGAQTLSVDNYNLEVKEVLQKKTIGTLSPAKGNKYIGIDIVIEALSDDVNKFDLSNLEIKSDNGEYEAQFLQGSSGSNKINVKKRKTRRLFAQVDKSFKSGSLYYNGEKVGSIQLSEGMKKGAFAVAK